MLQSIPFHPNMNVVSLCHAHKGQIVLINTESPAFAMVLLLRPNMDLGLRVSIFTHHDERVLGTVCQHSRDILMRASTEFTS